ncbi:hypothetical protein L1887_14320 [Cichorium endivia]|nr:hypothetical protein L1887_14320 [Cichorium endivia]
MSKARYELEEVIGKEDRTVEESDISRLPYLLEIQVYVVPNDALIMCNFRAMGQDPNVWSNAQIFRPEKFIDVGIDYKGRDFQLIPFSVGRRICSTLPLAHKILLHMMLGGLIYRFDWKRKKG